MAKRRSKRRKAGDLSADILIICKCTNCTSHVILRGAAAKVAVRDPLAKAKLHTNVLAAVRKPRGDTRWTRVVVVDCRGDMGRPPGACDATAL